MIVAFTGHRPQRLVDKAGKPVQCHVFNVIEEYLIETRPDAVISGMAQGVDLFAARIALILGIPLTAAVPWNKGKRKDA